jgi:hypothetical protein
MKKREQAHIALDNVYILSQAEIRALFQQGLKPVVWLSAKSRRSVTCDSVFD